MKKDCANDNDQSGLNMQAVLTFKSDKVKIWLKMQGVLRGLLLIGTSTFPAQNRSCLVASVGILTKMFKKRYFRRHIVLCASPNKPSNTYTYL